MELYIFGNNRVLLGVVESYEYLRWTRRYSRVGSFELIAIATPENLALLKEGNILYKSNDEEAGIIERVELSQTDREIITANGRFATSFLARRIIWGTETLRGDISAAVSQLLTRHLISPTDTARKISGFAYSAPTLGVTVSTQTSYRNLLESISDLCDAADVGLMTTFNPATGLFTVTLYAGGTVSAVFSKEYENLTEQTYIESVDDYANTALIGGEGEGAARQFVTIIQGTGENRREVFVDARDLQAADFLTGYTDALTFRGQSRLSEPAPRYSFDAGVNPHGNLRYKADFDIGNSVTVISKTWGVTMTARIAEIEETYDRGGLSLQLTFGKSELTLSQKMRSDISGMKTSILAPASGGGSGEIPDASVTSAKVADNAITTDKIAAGAVTAAEIAAGAVTTAKIADANVTGAKIASGAVATANIADSAVTNAKLGALAVTEAKIGDLAVTAAKIANSTITGGKIASLTIATGNIADSAVTNAKLGALAVTEAKIGDLAVTAAKIAASTITGAKIASLTIATGNIADSAVSTAKIAASAVTTAKMAQEADTAISISWGTGISLAGTNNSYVNKGVVSLGFQILVSTAVSPGGTILTITNTNFRPYTTVRSVLVPVPTFVTNVPITISSAGVLVNAASGTTLPTGYYMVCVTYARA